MRYYLDTEFDGFNGPLISLALVREDGESLYLVTDHKPRVQWVKANVVPILDRIPSPFPGAVRFNLRNLEVASALEWFLHGDPAIHIIADWPDDIAYLMRAFITGPGQMISTAERMSFEIVRVDAYPTTLPGAVRHNAYWDAKALQHLMMGRA